MSQNRAVFTIHAADLGWGQWAGPSAERVQPSQPDPPPPLPKTYRKRHSTVAQYSINKISN